MAGITNKDTMYTKLFVGGLPYHTTDQTLKEHFDQYGDIEEAVVITDRVTNKSKGYGFVTMADAESARKAIQDPNPVIDGRKANVNLAYIGAKPRGMPALSHAALLKPGIIASPHLAGLSPYFVPGMLPGPAAMSLSQLPLLQHQAQISPPTAAAAQYPTLADYAAYGAYPGIGGIEFPTSPTTMSAAAYGGITSPHLSMSLPQSAMSLAGLQFQQQLQQGETRLQ